MKYFLLLQIICLVSIQAIDPILKPGKLLYSNLFNKEIEPAWIKSKGDWKIQDSQLQGLELAADHHAAALRLTANLPDSFILTFEFKSTTETKSIGLSLNGQASNPGHICSVSLSAQKTSFTRNVDKKSASDKPETIMTLDNSLSLNEWHKVQLHCHKDQFYLKVNDKAQVGSNSLAGRPKANPGFYISGGPAFIRNFSITEGLPNNP
jgi:hypothetical protein